MSNFLQLVFSGLAQGGVYGLVALGFVAVFSVREIVNLAQGEYAALAGLSAITAVGAGLPLWAAVLVVIPLVVGVAVLLERLTIAPVKEMTPLALHHLDPWRVHRPQGAHAAHLGPGGQGADPVPGF